MTRIQFRQNGKHFMAVFTGHSDAKRENGNDLVCAAVSTLAQSLMQGLSDAIERGHIAKVIKMLVDERDGALSVDVLSTEAGFPYVMGAFTTVATGCAMLADKYPGNVSLGRNFKSYSV